MLSVNEVLEIALILDGNRYNKLYYAGLMIGIVLLIIMIIIFTCKYQSYYITMGTMIDNKLELLVNIDDIRVVEENNIVTINDKNYKYTIVKIDKELYRDDNFNNYKSVFLKIDNLSNIDNYVYKIKIPKEYKALVSYIKDFIKEV